MITILPESRGNVLAVKANGKLTVRDYEDVFIPKLEELIREHGKVRALLYLAEDFDGWEMGAMWDDARVGLKHRKDFEKMAVVGGPGWVQKVVRAVAPLMSGEVKTFAADELEEALHWIAD